MRKFTLLMLFAFTALLASAQTNILVEDFSSITSGNSTSTSGSATPWTGNDQFPTVSNAYQAGEAVKLGTSSKVGSITSIPLDLSVNGGAFKVKLKVKGWTTVEGQISITCGSLAAQTLSYSATISNSFEEIEASFTGGTANSTITIATTAKRAFIDEVTVYYGGSNLSNDASLADLQLNGTTISGFSATTTNYFVTLPASTSQVPTITATPTHAHATATVVPATSYLRDTAYVNVTAENGTTEKQYTIYFSKEAADGEKGSKSNPYTVTEAKTLLFPTGTTTQYWVKGYVAGSVVSSGSSFALNTTDVDTNIALADASGETEAANLIPVELPAGAVRTALGVVSNPGNKGALVEVYGSLVLYFSTTGLRSTSDYQILSSSGVNSELGNSELSVFANDGKLFVGGAAVGTPVHVYTVSGSLVTSFVASGNVSSTILTKGFYIVKVGKLGFKALVK
jgi:hypothetical protein